MLYVQNRGMTGKAISYVSPPIPEEIRTSFNPQSFRQYPRWYPTIAILRTHEQQSRQSAQLSPDDAESVYRYCKILSGLESGEIRTYTYEKGIPTGTSVLFYQKQTCKCNATKVSSSTQGKKVCHGSPTCEPFILIVQVPQLRLNNIYIYIYIIIYIYIYS